MSDHDREFLSFYNQERVDDQIAYYRNAAQRHGEADERLIWMTGVLMFVAAAVSAAVGFASDALPFPDVWKVLAVVVPGVSAAVAATRALYEHESNRARYENTRRDLVRLSGTAAPAPSLADAEYQEALASYVEAVEELLTREHRQWVQTMESVQRAQAPGE
jgi:hypothetical protein